MARQPRPTEPRAGRIFEALPVRKGAALALGLLALAGGAGLVVRRLASGGTELRGAQATSPPPALAAEQPRADRPAPEPAAGGRASPPADPAAPGAAPPPGETSPVFDDPTPGVPDGIALFPPLGTDPLRRGILVPDDFELPEGYVRHYQTTDDGELLPAILMFHPDYEWLDAGGEPLALPPDRIVPPELAPPGLDIRWLELPAGSGAAGETP
jgi:hypothetical protein